MTDVINRGYADMLIAQTDNLNTCVLWQYNDAAKLQQLIAYKQAFSSENNSMFLFSWYGLYFLLEGAEENGLALWATILNLAIYFLDNVSPPDYPAIGFIAYGDNFYGKSPPDPEAGMGANFAVGGSGVSSLSTAERRLLLMLRYYQITTRGTVTEINKMLADLFGNAYVIDNHDMSMTYVFNDPVSANLQDYLRKNDILPRPAGVKRKITYYFRYSFGFEDYQDAFLSNFKYPAVYP